MDDLKTAYLAAEGYEKQLLDELKGVIAVHGRLILTNLEVQKAFWAQNVWYEPFISTFQSISEGASILKNIQRNWAFYPLTEHRRAALIKNKLPYISDKLVTFPTKIQSNNMGSWVLLDKHTLLASPVCSSPYPNGIIPFEECREGPPSRAYLKLWEALTLGSSMPGNGDKCLEIGASPGGWTWVLANLKAEVISVDRTELAPSVAAMKGVHFVKGDAFSMTPSKVGVVDWIFSDVACFPEKLLEWVQVWIASGKCTKFICTLKFQGENSYAIVNEFSKIEGSRILHLGNNKHELTWILIN
jgi:23S rRNA (cytidine2498-2'-O)-methyltransferase